MPLSHRGSSFSTRFLLASAWGMICALVIAAPVLVLHSCHRAAAVLYLFFSPICHQIPERSFMLSGCPLAVCHRCSGLYLGMFLGSLIENHALHRSGKARRYWVLGAIVPMCLDALGSAAGLWTGTGVTRFATGLLFGILISSLVVRGFSEFAHEYPRLRLTTRNSPLKGGLTHD